jgi:hypothetical protein
MKKHFLLLGKAGIIYYCWTLILLFISFIFFYEKNSGVSYGQLGFLAAFFLCLFYGLINSYWLPGKLKIKLPYLRLRKISGQPQLIGRWSYFSIWKTKSDYQSYYLLTFSIKTRA